LAGIVTLFWHVEVESKANFMLIAAGRNPDGGLGTLNRDDEGLRQLGYERAAVAEVLGPFIRPPPQRPDRSCRRHRFRDTFAVSLLQKGVPLDQVSILLRTDVAAPAQQFNCC
jgi:hypothetical protein